MLAPGSALLSAAFAGLVAVGATVAIERWGGRLGGVLASLPTTIVPASLGIAAAAPSAAQFRDAMLSVPAGMLLNAAFLWLWRVLPSRLPARGLGRRLAAMVVLSLTGWLLGAVVVVRGGAWWRARDLPVALLGVGTTLVIMAVGIAACVRPLPAPRGRRHVGPLTLVARGLLAGASIGVSVLVAATGQPLLAGIASVFPAIFTTTMVSLWLAQGEAVPLGAVGPLMLGSSAVAGYALLAALLLPILGTTLGAATAWIGAVLLCSLPAALWLSHRPRSATA